MLFSLVVTGQEQPMEEASAEVFLEEYTDEFQDKFFEALKQKGIENYDRAINLLLECKQLDKANSVIDHELAKAYLADKQFVSAQESAISAVMSEPENLWYLTTLVDILQIQGNPIEAIRDNIPYANTSLQQNLALIYYQQKDYENALIILKGLKSNAFSTDLSSKIQDAVEAKEQSKEVVKQVLPVNTANDNPLVEYQTKLEDLMAKEDFGALEQLSAEALENFPVQPFFYYARGLALNKRLKHQEAIMALEMGLEYWLEDEGLLNKMYEELVIAYTALGNAGKANAYQNKIKSRS